MTKISDLPLIDGADVDPAADLLPIVDASLTGLARSKAIKVEELREALDIPTGSVGEAPIDGEFYARKDGDWEIAPSGGGGSIAVEDDGTEIVASATRLNFTGAGVTVTDSGSGEAQVAIAGGGGGGWTLADSWSHAVSGNTASPINFTGLAGAQDIQIIIEGATGNVSSNMGVRVSVDNGATFFSTLGDYVSVDDAGIASAASAFRIISTSATAARSGQILLSAVNVDGSIKADVMTEAGRRHQFVASTSPINAVQVVRLSGGNFTGGRIFCLAR